MTHYAPTPRRRFTLTNVEPWQVRKVLYAAAALIMAIAVLAGWIDQATVDRVLPQLDQGLMLLSTLLLSLATARTSARSDTPPEP